MPYAAPYAKQNFEVLADIIRAYWHLKTNHKIERDNKVTKSLWKYNTHSLWIV